MCFTRDAQIRTRLCCQLILSGGGVLDEGGDRVMIPRDNMDDVSDEVRGFRRIVMINNKFSGESE